MSKAGNFAAYQSSRPISEDFGDNMVKAEDQQFKYRQEKQQKERYDYQKKRQQEKDYQTDLEKQKLIQTGFEPMDKLYTRLYFDNMEQLGENHRLLQQGGLSAEKRQEIHYQNAMLNKTPEFLESVSTKAQEYATIVSEGIKNGTISGAAEEELKTLKAMFQGRFKDINMVNGKPVATVVDEDGKEVKVDYGEVIQGFKFNTADLPAKVDQDSWIKTFSEGLGKREVGGYENGMYGVKQTFEPHRQFVSDTLDAELGTADDPSSFAKSIWVDNMGKSLKDFNQNSIKEIKQNLLQGVERSYDQTFKGSQAHQYNSGSGISATQQKKQQRATSLHRLGVKGAMGDMESLASIKGQQSRVMIDGKSTMVVAGMPYKSGDSIIIPDSEGEHTLAEIPIAGSSEEANASAAQLLPWLYSGSATDAMDLFEMGASLRGGQPYQTGDSVPEMQSVEVGALDDVSYIDNIQFDGTSDSLIAGLQSGMTKETGFTFSSGDDYISNNELIIKAPNGQKFEVQLQTDWNKKRPEAIEEIKQIILNNQINKKKKIVPAEGKSKNEDRLGLGI